MSSALAASVTAETIASQMNQDLCASAQANIARPPRACAPRSSHRVHDEIHRELGVVSRAEALVLPRVIPLAPIVLIRVDDPHAAVPLDAAQIAVYDVVAPAIQLVRRLRRSIELEERVIHAMLVRQLLQCTGSERARHLALERFRVETVHVVIAIVREQQSAVVDVPHQAPPLLLADV